MIATAGAFGLGLASGGAAQAAEYCVDKPNNPDCDVSAVNVATIQDGLNQAAATASSDTLRIKAGAFDGPFTYVGTSGITVLGATRDNNCPVGEDCDTTLLDQGAAPAGTPILDIEATEGAVVEDVEVELPAGQNRTGIFLETQGAAVAERVHVAGGGAAADSVGLALDSVTGVVEGVRVIMSTSVTGAALSVLGAQSMTVDDVDLRAYTGVVLRAPTILRRARIRATYGVNVGEGSSTIDTAEIVLTGTDAAGLQLLPTPAARELSARNVTILGNGNADDGALLITPSSPAGATAKLTLRDSVISGTSTAVNRISNGPAADVDLSSSSYDPGGLVGIGAGGFTQTNRLPTPPGFVNPNPPMGFGPPLNLRLRHDSPLIDAGALIVIGPSSPLDLDGLPRLVLGKASGQARRDAGAYEYQRRPPVVDSAVAAVAGEQTVTFSGEASDPDAGDPLTYRWRFDDGAEATGPSVSHDFAAGGPHTATLTVTDPTGLTASATTAPVIILGLVDRISPVISRLRLTRKRFAVGRKRTPLAAARPRAGTAFRFDLSEPATVSISMRRCVRAARARRRGRGKRCARYGRARTLTRELAGGTPRIAFSGRVGRRKLATGRYRATLVARDPAGNESNRRSIDFRVVPRR